MRSREAARLGSPVQSSECFKIKISIFGTSLWVPPVAEMAKGLCDDMATRSSLIGCGPFGYGCEKNESLASDEKRLLVSMNVHIAQNHVSF